MSYTGVSGRARWTAALLVGLVAGLGLARAAAQGGTNLSAVWANDGGDKVTQHDLPTRTAPARTRNSLWDGQRVRLFGARNETVAFNLVLEAAVRPAGGVSVVFNLLTRDGGGGRIESAPARGDGIFDWRNRDIELFFVRYLEIKGLSRLSYDSTYDEQHVPCRFRRPYLVDAEGRGVAAPGTGWQNRPDHNQLYPEIAVPLELVPSFGIEAGQNRSIWADITIPKDVPPGLYHGAVRILEGGALTRIVPVELRVRPFDLPDTPSARTMVALSDENINRRYLGQAYPDPEPPLARLLRDRHFQLAHRHRVSLIGDGPADAGDPTDPFGDSTDDTGHPSDEWIPRLDGSLFTAARGYGGPGVGVGNGVYSIGTYGLWLWRYRVEDLYTPQNPNPAIAIMRRHTDAWQSWFEAHAPGTEHFLYLIDESSDYAEIERWARWINQNPGPGGRLMSLATVTSDVFPGVAHPDRGDPLAPYATPTLDIPASLLGFGRRGSWSTTVAHYRSTAGKRYFFYNGQRPASGSFCTEDDGVALRELAWGQYKHRINRWFYWESTYYNDFQSESGETDLFKQAKTFGAREEFDPVDGETGWNYTNGDGVLFYPGTDRVFPANSYGVNGPLASLRLKHWRRGIQDVDYLTLAAALDPAAVSAIVGRMVPKALWEYGIREESDPTYQFTDISWSTNPDAWEAARAQLADIIERHAPPAPASLTAKAVSSTQAQLSWADRSANETAFVVERKQDAGAYARAGTAPANATGFLAGSLEPGHRYTFRVRASNAAGASAASNEAAVLMLAAPRSLLAVSPSSTRVVLTWQQAVAGEAGFRIERWNTLSAAPVAFVEIGAAAANATTFTDAQAAANVPYVYRVRAYAANSASGYSNEARVTVLGAPTNLTFQLPAPTSVRLTWRDGSAGETGFRIERRTGTGEYAVIGSAGANATTFSQTGLARGATYTYRVRAYAPNSASGYSNEIRFTAPP